MPPVQEASGRELSLQASLAAKGNCNNSLADEAEAVNQRCFHMCICRGIKQDHLPWPSWMVHRPCQCWEQGRSCQPGPGREVWKATLLSTQNALLIQSTFSSSD